MILVACGLKREAAIIDRPDVMVIAGSGDRGRFESELDINADLFAARMLSSGVAGALDPSLRPGDVVLDGDPALVAKLQVALPKARTGKVIGVDRAAATSAEKRALFHETGAIAVDMESHIAERIAKTHELAFAIVRVISDGGEESLPPAALVGMHPDGGVAFGRVLLSLLIQPRQLPALIRTARHADLAFRELRRVHDVLFGGGVGGFDLRKLALDM